MLLRLNAFKRIERLAIFLILWTTPYLLALFLNARGVIHWAWLDLGYGPKNMLLLRHGHYFALGMLVWLFKEGRIGKAGVLAGGYALILALMEIYSRGVQLQPNVTPSAYFTLTPWTHLALSANCAFAIGFAAILLSVRFNHLFPASSALRRIVRSLGLMTYPFYLVHQRVGSFIVYQLDRAGMALIPCILLAMVGTAAGPSRSRPISSPRCVLFFAATSLRCVPCPGSLFRASPDSPSARRR
jgi:peptidoglycan/LPS O-acetylase OafA/YrhL